jgi:hypothetical protein
LSDWRGENLRASYIRRLETGGNARKTRAIARGGGRIGKKIYPGQHEAIIEPELWQAVQDRLAAGRRERSI